MIYICWASRIKLELSPVLVGEIKNASTSCWGSFFLGERIDGYSDRIKVSFHIRHKSQFGDADGDVGRESRDMWAVKRTQIHTHTNASAHLVQNAATALLLLLLRRSKTGFCTLYMYAI